MGDNLLLNFVSKFETCIEKIFCATRVARFLRVSRDACISPDLRGSVNVDNLVPTREKGREGPGKKAEVRGCL